jgi:hypothetical protein
MISINCPVPSGPTEAGALPAGVCSGDWVSARVCMRSCRASSGCLLADFRIESPAEYWAALMLLLVSICPTVSVIASQGLATVSMLSCRSFAVLFPSQKLKKHPVDLLGIVFDEFFIDGKLSPPTSQKADTSLNNNFIQKVKTASIFPASPGINGIPR